MKTIRISLVHSKAYPKAKSFNEPKFQWKDERKKKKKVQHDPHTNIYFFCFRFSSRQEMKVLFFLSLDGDFYFISARHKHFIEIELNLI